MQAKYKEPAMLMACTMTVAFQFSIFKRWAGKNVFEMTYSVSNGTSNLKSITLVRTTQKLLRSVKILLKLLLLKVHSRVVLDHSVLAVVYIYTDAGYIGGSRHQLVYMSRQM